MIRKIARKSALILLFATFSAGAQMTRSDPDYLSGYAWAGMHNMDDPATCSGKTAMFVKGCVDYATKYRREKAAAMVQSGTARALTWYPRSCSEKCHAICEAAEQLRTYSLTLASCAEHSGDCDTEFSNVKDAHDELDEAISNAGSDCDN